MRTFSFKSISFRFSMIAGLTIAALVLVLFFAYVKQQKEAVISGEVHAARNLVLMSESVRENMEEKWRLGMFSPEMLRNMEYSSQQELKKKLLAAVPVSAAWNAAKAKSKEGGFEFRTPRKGARNPANEPDAIETEILDYFKYNPGVNEHYVIDEKRNAIRYFRPVRLGEVCMNCHGDPATSYKLWRRHDGKDITGFTMDNKKVGDLHGAFEIIRPLDDADAALAASLWKAGFIATPMFLFAVFLSWTTARRVVTRPLEQAIQVCTRIAQGDLTADIQTGRDDEVGNLLKALRTMNENLNHIVRDVNDNAKKIHYSSEEVVDGSTNLSQRTEQQASALEETASSMEEMTGTVKQCADSAQEARQIAESNRLRAQKGSEVVARTIQAMSEINTSSSRIADIIGTIDGIAFQTNLLALNAAVEAARAGEQGRGFAVVASEVRNLAGRSAQAAKEIKTLIEDSVGKVRNGATLVEESGETLADIINGARRVADIISEIAAASNEQASGIDQVNNAVTQMDEMTQQNAAFVEETSAAARWMMNQASHLTDLMDFFTLQIENEQQPTQSRQSAKPVALNPASSVNTTSEITSPEKNAVNRDWESF